MRAHDMTDELEKEDEMSRIIGNLRTLAAESPVVVQLYRQRTGEPKAKYLMEIDPDNFNLEYIRTTFGGGAYSGRIVTAADKKIKGNLARFEIDESWTGAHDRRGASSGPVPASNGGLGDVPAIVKALKESGGGGNGMEVMLTFMQMQAQAQQEQNRMMLQMQQETTKLMISVLGGKGGGQSDLNAVLLEAALRDRGGIGEAVKAMKELQEITGDGPVKPGLLEQLAPLAGVLLPGLLGAMRGGPPMMLPEGPPATQRSQVQVRPAAPAPVVLPHPAERPAAPVADSPATFASLPLEQQQQMLRQLIVTAWDWLALGAANGTDPVSYANMIADRCGPDLDAVQALLKRDDWLTLFPPDAQKNIAWFTELRDSLADDQSDDTVAGQPPAR